MTPRCLHEQCNLVTLHAPRHIQAAVEPLLHLKQLTFNFLWSYIRMYEVVVVGKMYDMLEQHLHWLLQNQPQLYLV